MEAIRPAAHADCDMLDNAPMLSKRGAIYRVRGACDRPVHTAALRNCEALSLRRLFRPARAVYLFQSNSLLSGFKSFLDGSTNIKVARVDNTIGLIN